MMAEDCVCVCDISIIIKEKEIMDLRWSEKDLERTGGRRGTGWETDRNIVLIYEFSKNRL